MRIKYIVVKKQMHIEKKLVVLSIVALVLGIVAILPIAYVPADTNSPAIQGAPQCLLVTADELANMNIPQNITFPSATYNLPDGTIITYYFIQFYENDDGTYTLPDGTTFTYNFIQPDGE